jgi:hypothetical protein
LGKTPLNLRTAPTGAVSYTFKLDGYFAANLAGTVKNGEWLTRRATLAKLPSPTMDPAPENGFGVKVAGGGPMAAHGRNSTDSNTPVSTETMVVAAAPPAEVKVPPAVAKPSYPQLDAPCQNSLGMKFFPVPGTAVLFSVWDTRVQDYRVFADATGREPPKPRFAQGPTHPAVKVSWDDAEAFCQWLTARERTAGKIGAAQFYRLPTDDEWSAAVGLTEAKEGSPKDKSGKVKDVYPWGTQWPPPRGSGNYAKAIGVHDYDYTSPAGSFAPNKFGLYDMGGNVWQWCEDLYDSEQTARVLRGCSFLDYDAVDALSSFRSWNLPGTRVDSDGFRCVLAAGQGNGGK